MQCGVRAGRIARETKELLHCYVASPTAVTRSFLDLKYPLLVIKNERGAESRHHVYPFQLDRSLPSGSPSYHSANKSVLVSDWLQGYCVYFIALFVTRYGF